jgi:hypothetical protein
MMRCLALVFFFKRPQDSRESTRHPRELFSVSGTTYSETPNLSGN